MYCDSPLLHHRTGIHTPLTATSATSPKHLHGLLARRRNAHIGQSETFLSVAAEQDFLTPANSRSAPPWRVRRHGLWSKNGNALSEGIGNLRELPQFQELSAHPGVKVIRRALRQARALDELLDVHKILSTVGGNHARSQL